MTAQIAILTVVRNDLAGLIATRASLRAQRCQDFDWIVVDGASTDGTAEWLARHGGEMTWWRSAPDGGIYDAMNVALEAATTSHVLFLNAGDTLAGPEVTARLGKAVTEAPDAGLIYGDALERLPDGRVVKKPARSHRLAMMGMFTHHQAILYRRKAVPGLRFDLRFALAADYAFTLSVLHGNHNALRLRIPLCVFAPGGASQQDASRGRKEQAIIRQELMGQGIWANATLWCLQWLALMMRKHIPKLYAKFRFQAMETSCLS